MAEKYEILKCTIRWPNGRTTSPLGHLLQLLCTSSGFSRRDRNFRVKHDMRTSALPHLAVQWLEDDLALADFPVPQDASKGLVCPGSEPLQRICHQILLDVIGLAWGAKSHDSVIRRVLAYSSQKEDGSNGHLQTGTEAKRHQVSKGNWGYEDAASEMNFPLHITLSNAPPWSGGLN